MTKKIRGVNIGGWLVLEKWLTPKLFSGTDAIDEYTFMQSKNADKKIEHHRQIFITKKDFKWMYENNINLVRIPVGHWLFDAVDGYTPTVNYLDDAMKWAGEFEIDVLIDFHAAKGSQNGFDNSGKAGKIEWFVNRQFQTETIEIILKIANRYKDAPALWGIELLNEPVSKGHYFALLRYYREAYKGLTDVLRPGTTIVFHDSFRPLLFTGSIRRRRSHPVMMDIHWYAFPFGTAKLTSYLRLSALSRKLLIRFLQLWQPVLVGEWSSVLPQRFFHMIPTDEHFGLLGQNVSMQMHSYKYCAGWIYWNYKAEGEGMWNFRSLVESRVIESIDSIKE